MGADLGAWIESDGAGAAELKPVARDIRLNASSSRQRPEPAEIGRRIDAG
jgi:hypothetical protein